MDNSSLFSAISSIVNIGFAVVVGVYLLTKAIPKMQEDHSKDMKTQRDDFLAELKLKREESRVDDRERRAEFKEALKIISEHCEREGERRDRVLQVELSSVSRSHEDQARVMEEIRNLLVQLTSASKSQNK